MSQLELVPTPDRNADLIGYTWVTADASFRVTGTSAQPTYVNVLAYSPGGTEETCRPVALVRQHKLAQVSR